MMSRATLWADAERETGTNWSPTPEVICGVANGNPVVSNGTSRKNMFGMQQCNLFSAPRNKWRVNRKACRHYQLNSEDVEYNHQQSRIRAKGEHAFLVVKHLWHYHKVRYKGLFKNAAQVFSLFALANLYLVRHELQMTRV